MIASAPRRRPGDFQIILTDEVGVVQTQQLQVKLHHERKMCLSNSTRYTLGVQTTGYSREGNMIVSRVVWCRVAKSRYFST